MQGPLEKLMQGYDVETNEGMTYRRPLDVLIETAKLSLFFGDPKGKHWCICCQTIKEFGLTRKDT